MNSKMKTISVIGLGYIGLPTAAVLSSHNVNVIGVDINKYAIDTINKGKIHILEPDLDAVVNNSVAQGYLRAVDKPEPSDAFLIAVPTPFKVGAVGLYEPDISFIEAAAKSIAPVLKKGDLVILESTSPVGTTEKMAEWLAEDRADLTFPQTHGEESDVRVAYCPERVLPGRVLIELVKNDRVIGGLTPKCSAEAVNLYKIFVQGECIITNARTAEMCKLTENSFRDVNIAFANELSLICDKLNIDVWELIGLANRHPRVNILLPGPGVGGHCIAVDPWFIVNAAPDQSRLIKLARVVNDSKPDWVVEKVRSEINKYINSNKGIKRQDICIAFFGIAFKPDIDDLRESPSLEIVARLSEIEPCKIYVVEPNICDLPNRLNGRVDLVNVDEVLAKANISVILVAHNSYKAIVKSLDKVMPVIDVCGIV
jgi:UDP-N-acetyl-D-mannosaminuronic acid dehydrogenase